MSAYGIFNRAGVTGDNTLQLDMGEIREILNNPNENLTDTDISKIEQAKPGDKIKLSDGWTYRICNEPYRYNGVII